MNQSNKIDELDVYGEQVTEVLSRPPSKLFTMGNIIVTVFIILIFSLSYIVKFPDVVTSEISITSKISPINIVSELDGRITDILISSMSSVDNGTVLAIISSEEDYSEIIQLKVFLDSFYLNNENEQISFPEFSRIGQIGDIYNNMKLEYEKLLSYIKINPEINDAYQITIQKEKLNSINKNLSNQIKLIEKQSEYHDAELKRSEKLFSEKVISQAEFEKAKLYRLDKRREYESLKNLRLQNLNELQVLNRNYENLQTLNVQNLEFHRLKILEFLRTCKSEIQIWESKHLLKAPKSGRVVYLDHWRIDQHISKGTELFSIIDDHNEYFGKGYLSEIKSGKVKIGQKAIIKLYSFPEKEYGSLSGVVESISDLPQKGQYLITVRLQNGLKTSYKKDLPNKATYNGTCEIVTEDLRVIERIFYEFRNVFSR
jgi:multidrug resistance efflux pump